MEIVYCVAHLYRRAYGAPLTEKHGELGLSFSAGLLWKIAVGDGGLPNDNFPFWVDVRDVAKAHINALIEPSAFGSRWILAPSSFMYKQVIVTRL
jgi:hypothetical protein